MVNGQGEILMLCLFWLLLIILLLPRYLRKANIGWQIGLARHVVNILAWGVSFFKLTFAMNQ